MIVSNRLPRHSQYSDGRIRLLILSDLHFTADTNVHVERQCLLNDLLSPKRPEGMGLARGDIDFLLVAGDFTHRGCCKGMEQAATFLSEVSDEMHIPRDNILLVPGNHDIPDSTEYFSFRWEGRDRAVIFPHPEKYKDRFREFSARLHHPLLGRPYLCDSGKHGTAVLYSGYGIQFLLLNSCEQLDQRGETCPCISALQCLETLRVADDQLSKDDKWKIAPPFRIAMWHHPAAAPLSTHDPKRIADVSFAEHLSKANAKMLIWGDIHESNLGSTEGFLYNEHQLHTICCGTFGSTSRPSGVRQHYSMLEILTDFSKFTLHHRERNDLGYAWHPSPVFRQRNGNPSGSHTRSLHRGR